MPGPQLLLQAGASPGRVDVKLVLLLTPPLVFSSHLAKRPICGKFSPPSFSLLR